MPLDAVRQTVARSPAPVFGIARNMSSATLRTLPNSPSARERPAATLAGSPGPVFANDARAR